MKNLKTINVGLAFTAMLVISVDVSAHTDKAMKLKLQHLAQKFSHVEFGKDDYVSSDSAQTGTTNNNLFVSYTPQDANYGEIITPSGELVFDIIPGREISNLHSATHGLLPSQRHTLPPYYVLPSMQNVDDFVVTEDEMVVINPAPGEYVRIMEGKRHGYRSTTVGLSITTPGGGAPLHTHESEETHVLLKGHMRYQLGDDVFEVQAPYVVNLPPMVPHAFMNLSETPIELVVFFPVNKWEFDFVEHENMAEFFTLPKE